MQLETPVPVSDSAAQPVAISIEFVAYLAILAFSLVLRLAELDTTPLLASETHNALAAWRAVMPNVSGVPLVSSSPILFALQSLSFTLFGGSEITSRIATVIAGLVLILTPALFRPLLGKTRALLISLLLAFSPVLLIASRSSSADVWALLFAVLALWGYWQSGRTESIRHPIFTVVMFAMLLFLTGSGGFALGLILLVAGGLTALWRRNVLPPDEDEASENGFSAIRRSASLAFALALLVVLAISTGFMLYPAGMSSIGEGIGGAVRALIQPQGINGYGTLGVLFYEPVLWLLAIVGLILRRERLATVDVFLAIWIVLGVVVSLFFADAVPDHALWLTVPLSALAASALVWALTPDNELVLPAVPRWGRALVALGTVAVLAVFTLAFQSMARSMVQAPQPLLTAVSPPPDSVILVLVSLMFLIIGYFLFASLWGSRASWQGIILGIAVFGAITSLGSGWSTSVPNAPNPVAFWHSQATNGDTTLMRKTLFEVADRVSGGWPAMPVKVMASQDGELAWLLRDFNNTQFITDLNDAQNAEVVILPETDQPPQLGAAYVGQDFTISRAWDPSSLNAVDIPAWWTQLQTRSPWASQDNVVLWLRQDVYNGLNQSSTQDSTG